MQSCNRETCRLNTGRGHCMVEHCHIKTLNIVAKDTVFQHMEEGETITLTRDILTVDEPPYHKGFQFKHGDKVQVLLAETPHRWMLVQVERMNDHFNKE
jgi:hypothetical protein